MSLYWKCQVAGWSAVVLWSVMASLIFGNLRWESAAAATAMSMLGLGLTHTFRPVIHRGGWKEMAPIRLAPRVFGVSWGIGILMGALSFPFLLPVLPEEARQQHVLISNIISAFFVVLGWFLVYFCVHYFQRGREAKERALQLQVAVRENELRTLRSQLNPHFLFNSLNSLRGLISERPERAQEAVTSLASLLRHTLRLSAHSTIPLRLELEAARNYLALEEMRFEERLTCKVEVDPELLEQAVPPMLLQNLLENALKHGISRFPDGGTVELYVHREEDRVHLSVSNPGRVASASQVKGVGLSNVREQLRLLFRDEATLELAQEGRNRVVCRVVLPLRLLTREEEGAPSSRTDMDARATVTEVGS